MKAVILAGGLRTRLSEETGTRPKPMAEIGGRPILCHIMKIYSSHGVNDFIICLGYKGHMIKEFFANYFMYMSDITVDLTTNSMEVQQDYNEPWEVTLVDTGADSMTGGRLKAISRFLPPDEPFCFTYGDGLTDLDIGASVAFHRRQRTLVTVTAVAPPGRFGALVFEGDMVTHFKKKPSGDGNWINGGFFVASPAALDYIDGPSTVWEREPMERLAAEGQLSAFLHEEFWHPLDTVRDKTALEDLWASGHAAWKSW